MNKKKLTENVLRLGKHFLKSLKENGLFNKFLTTYQKNSFGRNLSNANGNLFEAMMEDVLNLTLLDLRHRGVDTNNIKEDYGYYTNILNMLLHKYVEKGMHIHPERCAKMGEKIFNSFCSEIFGEEKFQKDMDEFNAKHNINSPKSKDNLTDIYNNLQKMGVNMNWEDFLNMHSQIHRMTITPSDMYYINDIETNSSFPF